MPRHVNLSGSCIVAFFSDCKNLHPLTPSLGMMGAQLKAPLKPLKTIVLWYTEGFMGGSLIAPPSRQYLGQLYVWSVFSFQRSTWPWHHPSCVFNAIWEIDYAQRNIFEIACNQPEINLKMGYTIFKIRLYIPFSGWFGTKRMSIWFQVNLKMVRTIWFRVDLIRFLCVCLETHLENWLRSAVRDTSVSRHHRDLIQDPPETLRTITALSYWGVQGDLQLGPRFSVRSLWQRMYSILVWVESQWKINTMESQFIYLSL